MFQYFANSVPVPEWMPGSRFWDLYMCDLWLEGKFYNHMPYGFWEEQSKNSNQINKMYEKRPSMQLNIPTLAADFTSRMLFAPSRAPRISHDDDAVEDAMKWLIKKSNMLEKMLEISFWGQSGSVAATLKIVKGVPVIDVWCGRYCTPTFDDAGELSELQLAYPVIGAQFATLKPPITIDYKGEEIKPDATYWYIRIYDDTRITTCSPIIIDDWNPVNGEPDRLRALPDQRPPHGLGEVPAVWITNLAGGNGIDGRSTFCRTLDNCIHLDYTLSQLGRGVNASASPTLAVKGRIINQPSGSGMMMLGPQGMIQLKADRKSGEQAETGADAKYLEMTGAGIDVGMEKFVMHVKHFALETISMSRKDPDTIQGAMSGKAMELIDNEPNNLVEVLKIPYGDKGELKICQKFGRMLQKVGPDGEKGHEKMKGVTDDALDEMECDWPKMYPATPDEVLALSTAMTNNIKGGLMDQEEARTYYASQIDLKGQGFDPSKIPDLEEMAVATGQKPSEEETQAQLEATQAKTKTTLHPPKKPGGATK